jgi:hypothetical protein
MFVPITSEVIIGTGSVLKEIATGHLFEVGARLVEREEVLGDDSWELIEIEPASPDRTVVAVKHQILAQKFLAEVED